MTVVRVPGLYMPTPVGVDRTGRLLLEAVADGGTHAVLADGEDHVVLPSLTGSPEATTTAADINDRGDAVGSSVTASGAQHAVLWKDGRVIDLHTLGTSSASRSIGANGHVAGTYVADDGTTRSFLWSCGHMIDLGGHGNGQINVNARGQVLVGTTLYTPTR
jgi:probable HAF family extracellular repeat protein